MTTLNPAARKRRGIAAVAVAAALLAGVSMLAAAPAHAGGAGDRFGGVGEVCGAEPGSIVRVTQSNPTSISHLNKTWKTAIAGQTDSGDPEGAARLAAQVALNAGIGQTEIVESGGSAMTYRAKVGADGCLVVPSVGLVEHNVRVQAPASKINGLVEFTAVPHLVENAPINIVWDDAIVSRSPRLIAPDRTYTHLDVFGFDLDWHIDIK